MLESKWSFVVEWWGEGERFETFEKDKHKPQENQEKRFPTKKPQKGFFSFLMIPIFFLSLCD